MQRICIVGGGGNMGKRYRAICKFIGIAHVSVDVGETVPEASHYIVATPTETHVDLSIKLARNGRVLCEKPMAFDMGKLNDLPRNVFMVNNYAFYPGVLNSTPRSTVYDFYNCGPHGPAWDCIQIIYLANSSCKILNTSPIWKCQINGVKLNREALDLAFCEMVRAFWKGQDKLLWNKADILKAHSKTLAFIASSEVS